MHEHDVLQGKEASEMNVVASSKRNATMYIAVISGKLREFKKHSEMLRARDQICDGSHVTGTHILVKGGHLVPYLFQPLRLCWGICPPLSAFQIHGSTLTVITVCLVAHQVVVRMEIQQNLEARTSNIHLYQRVERGFEDGIAEG